LSASRPRRIDGIASYPGPGIPGKGFSGADTHEVRNALGLRSRWYLSAMETAGQIGPAIEACTAVTLGLANHVVVFRLVWESTAQASAGRASVLFGGGELPPYLEYVAPFGALSAANGLALPAQRYMHDFGLTREQLGAIAINARRNAGLGFCGHGKVGEFIEGGERIALTGSLPLNTSGGQLSGRRLHGLGFLHEACVQLWGEGGERQAPGSPEIAVVGVGGGPVGGAMLLSTR